MNESSRQRLLDSAEVYALHAVSDTENTEIEADIARADDTARAQFAILVAEIQETLALVAAADALAAPAGLRERVLTGVSGTAQEAPEPRAQSNVTSLHRHRKQRSTRWRNSVLAAAAAVIVAVGGVVVAQQTLQQDASPSQAEQIQAAGDARVVTGDFPGGGTAKVSYSLSSDAAVVSLNGVPAPAPGKAYQMWFVDGAPRSAGVVSDGQLAPGSEIVVTGLGASTNFAFSLEPAGGSPQPTDVLTMVSLAA